MNNSNIEFLDPVESFEKAIEEGKLSRDENSEIYAGNYMYMGHMDGKAQFKNSCTREYL